MGEALFIALGARRPGEDAAYKAYVEGAPALLAAAGGRPRARLTIVERIFGDVEMETVLMMAFDDADAIRGVFASEAYRALVPHRERAFGQLTAAIAEDAT